MRILGISGSTRAESANLAILRAALEAAPAGADTQLYTGLSGLPQFNPDLDRVDARPPRPVVELRSVAATADAVLIVSPEYAHGAPGAMKNLLDWLVGSGEFDGLPAVVVTASPWPTGGEFANSQLCETLRMMGATVLTDHCVRIGEMRAKFGDDRRLSDPDSLTRLRDAMAALASPAAQPA